MPLISNGALDRYQVPQNNRIRIAALEAYDFTFLVHTFNDDLIRSGRAYSVEQVYPIVAKFGKADQEIAELVSEEFRKFVALTLLVPGVPHAPPGAVDMFWHYFILHSEQYAKFCENIWGSFQGDPKYRHHYPATDDTRQGQYQAYSATLTLYLEIFGEPPVYRRSPKETVPIWTPLAADDKLEKEYIRTCGDSYSGIIDPNVLEAADYRVR